MKERIINAWSGKPPRIYYVSEPFPGTPDVPLVGGGVANMSLEDFITRLEEDKKNQCGCYYTFASGGDNNEDDLYFLEGWEIYQGKDSCYEGLVVLYYSAVYPYQVIKKHMSEAIAEEYLQEQKAILN